MAYNGELCKIELSLIDCNYDENYVVHFKVP